MDALLLIPLLAGVLYGAAALCLRAAALRGIGGVQGTVVTQIALAAGFALFLPWGSGDPRPWSLPVALIAGGVFLAGQICTVFALRAGHASVSTPVLGLKAVLVPLVLAVGVGAAPAARTWIASAVAALGVLFLARSDGARGRELVPAVTWAFGSALCFAVFDVLVAHWSPTYGFGRVVPPAMVVAATGAVVLALALRVPLRPVWARPPKALVAGVALLTLQSVLFLWSVGHHVDTAAVNVAYSARGLWSVLLAAAVGARLGLSELSGGLPALWARLAGAGLILSGIGLVLLG